MKFAIQVSNPKVSGKRDPDDETLDECVETSFLFNTEMALIECGYNEVNANGFDRLKSVYSRINEVSLLYKDANGEPVCDIDCTDHGRPQKSS